jgi:hypothetical protein
MLIALQGSLFAVGGSRLAAQVMHVLAVVSTCVFFLIRRKLREEYRRNGETEPFELRVVPWLLVTCVVLLMLSAALGLGPWS